MSSFSCCPDKRKRFLFVNENESRLFVANDFHLCKSGFIEQFEGRGMPRGRTGAGTVFAGNVPVGAGKKDVQPARNRLPRSRAAVMYLLAMREVIATLSFRKQAGRRAWAVFCLLFFLALVVFSSSPQLHKLIHPDADSADHHCAVTMLAHGKVNAPIAPPVLAVFVPVLFFLLPRLRLTPVSSFDYRFSSSRAPPLM